MAAIEVKVPDIGDFKDVPVIEVLVKPGDAVKKDDSLLTLESDKATMEVPAPYSGVVKNVLVKVGDKVSEGVAIVTLQADAPAEKSAPAQAAPAPAEAAAPPPAPKSAPAPAPAPASAPASAEPSSGTPPHASPGVRRFARELGVDVAKVAEAIKQYGIDSEKPAPWTV